MPMLDAAAVARLITRQRLTELPRASLLAMQEAAGHDLTGEQVGDVRRWLSWLADHLARHVDTSAAADCAHCHPDTTTEER